jgi:hypothetical protein
MILVGSGGIWWDLVGSGGIWWWNQMIPPDPRLWRDRWWNHLIPQLSTISHQWQYIGEKLWNQRNSVEELRNGAKSKMSGSPEWS